MVKNTSHGSRRGAVTDRSQVRTHGGTWAKRSTSTGQFVEAKKTGGSFKGVRKEK